MICNGEHSNKTDHHDIPEIVKVALNTININEKPKPSLVITSNSCQPSLFSSTTTCEKVIVDKLQSLRNTIFTSL